MRAMFKDQVQPRQTPFHPARATLKKRVLRDQLVQSLVSSRTRATVKRPQGIRPVQVALVRSRTDLRPVYAGYVEGSCRISAFAWTAISHPAHAGYVEGLACNRRLDAPRASRATSSRIRASG